MLELEIIIDFLIYIPMLTLVVLVYILLCKVQKYRDEVEYLRSVCEQAIQISKQNEKKLEEQYYQKKRSHKQSFMIGYQKGKKKTNEVKK